MSTTMRCWIAGCLAAAGLATALGGGAARAAEESDRFLEGLRDRQYYDVALDYLETMRTSEAASQEFKQKIDYEAGSTLIDAARAGRVVAIKEKQLAEAEEKFNRFISQQADHPLVPGAKTQLANLLVERGKIKNEQGLAPTIPEAQSKALREEARGLFEEARKVLETLEKRFLEEHEKFPKIIEETDTRAIEERDRVRRDLLNARLALCAVLYEIARTYPEGSADHKKAMEAAAVRYKDFYDKYSTRLAGLYALMYAGRCYKEMGDAKKAFDSFEELLQQPDEPRPFRELKNKASVLALETALLPAVKKYQESIDLYRAWNQSSQPWENTTPEGMAIKCLAGQAALELARTLDKDKPDDNKRRRELLALAKKLFEEATRFPSEYRQRARMLAMSPELLGEDATIPEPTNFVEARDRGKLALDNMSAADLNKRLDLEKGDRENIERYDREIAEQRAEAVKYFQMALGMTDADTSIDELNTIRYYLSYLYWASGDAYSSAVLGEFLARRYPNAAGARQGAKIAMAAYAKMFNDAGEGDRQFESRRMAEIAEFITERWSGEPDADEAWMTLIRMAVMDRELDKATEYLQKIPPESPRRGEAELMTGQALWAAYLRASGAPEEDRLPQAQLEAMVERAQTTLQNGIERMRGAAEVTPTLALAVLSLAQINIEAGQADKAVGLLDDERIGVVTLVKAGHSATQRGSFPVETYKAALRAYVATQQLDKAEAAMKALEALTKAGGDAEADRRLTRIYIGLGFQLQKQLERLRIEGKTDEVKAVSEGFEMFLTRISQRQEGNTFNSLNWVASTFASLGAGFDTGGAELGSEADTYYRRAAATYRTILQRNQSEPGFIPEGAEAGVRVQLARCFRKLRDFENALGLLLQVLRERQTVVEAQVEAAYAFQDWGQKGQLGKNPDPKYYVLAISGSREYKEIWGWGTIARRVIQNPAFNSIFHEARYNLALCRFKLALSRQGEDQKKLLEQAENDILIVFRLYSDMGGDEWYPKYEALLKTIQKMLGKQPDGFKGIAATTTTAAK